MPYDVAIERYMISLTRRLGRDSELPARYRPLLLQGARETVTDFSKYLAFHDLGLADMRDLENEEEDDADEG